jgi:hypothetical protein
MEGIGFKKRWLTLVAALAVAAVVVPVALALTLNGSITNSDPTQNLRVFRNTVAASCASPKSNPGTTGFGAIHYDAARFLNNSGSTQCATVELTKNDLNCNVFSVAYSSFDPANVAANYLADPGLSTGLSDTPVGTTTSFSLNIATHTTFDVVVSEVAAGSGCASYTLRVTGTGIISADAAQAIGDLRDLVASMDIHHGITNALDSKLQNTLAALDAGDTATACLSMQEFLDLVKAQTGKKLTEDQADQLTESANNIRDQLGC